MKKLFKKLFGRLTFVMIAVLLQLALTFVLPYVLSYYYPSIFGNLVVTLNVVFSVLALIFTIKIINSDMPTEGQLIWVILILFLPILGITIYCMFVRRKPPRRHKKLYDSVSKETTKFISRSKEEIEDLKQILGDKFGQFEYLYRSTGLKAYTNSAVKYLSTGEEFCEELIRELENAKKYIFMEYFIIDEGQLWDRILQTLEKKVSEGVEVRVMYDDLGTINKLPTNFYKKLNKKGIKCVRFNAFTPAVSASHNNRDHRKMTIIDGQVGFMSGLNLADEYVNLIHPFGHWKDTGIKITGEAVKNMILMFLQLNDVQNRKIEDFTPYLNYEAKSVKSSGVICPFGDGPKYFYSEYVAINAYLNIINQAQRYLWITTPYLIVDNKLTNALCNAARRGVDVRIVTPHIPDKKIILGITRSSYKTLQEAGVKIFEYKDGFIHSKQVLCDDEIGIVGTINFDYRSLLHHYECGTLMYKTDCLKDMKKDFENLFTISLNMEGFCQSRIVRLFCEIMKLFTPLL